MGDTLSAQTVDGISAAEVGELKHHPAGAQFGPPIALISFASGAFAGGQPEAVPAGTGGRRATRWWDMPAFADAIGMSR